MRSQWYVVRGRPMHVLVGDAETGPAATRQWRQPIVMAHGLGVASGSLRRLGDELSRLGYRSYIPDQPGFGRSSGREQPPPLDMPRLADALVVWMSTAGLEQAAIFGNSVGGQIAADLAARHPTRASALILVGPTTDASARSFPRQLWRWLRNIPRDRTSTGPGMFEAYRLAGFKRVARTVQYALRDQIETKLSGIGVPTLVVGGSADPVAPPGWVRHVCQLLPAGRLVMLEETGHSMQNLRPRQLAREIERFLESVAGGA